MEGIVGYPVVRGLLFKTSPVRLSVTSKNINGAVGSLWKQRLLNGFVLSQVLLAYCVWFIFFLVSTFLVLLMGLAALLVLYSP